MIHSRNRAGVWRSISQGLPPGQGEPSPGPGPHPTLQTEARGPCGMYLPYFTFTKYME